MKKVLKALYVLILLVIVICLVFVSIYVVKGYNMYREAIDNKSISQMVEEIQSDKSFSRVEELPRIYIDAVVSVEDHRFYSHNGIDFIAIGRAVVHDIQSRDFVEGGSTITQQLAKNVYFSQEKKIERKIAEVFMAYKIEKELDKDDILELYLNTSYFGDGYYTIRDASIGYFGKEPINLTDAEAIMLAGIPNAPSVYAPTNNFELAKQRQRQVMNKMVEYKYLTEEERDRLLEQPVNVIE